MGLAQSGQAAGSSSSIKRSGRRRRCSGSFPPECALVVADAKKPTEYVLFCTTR
jgi:hypothetical protein